MAESDSEVRLVVPAGRAHQLVYRQERDQASGGADALEGFVLLRCPLQALPMLRAVWRAMGAVGTVKCLAKLCTGDRALYGVTREGRLVHRGWITLSRCRHYRVERGAAVIGPIWTDPDWRSRGLASTAAKAAMDTMMGLGHRVFYIDTSNDNVASQRVIAKCGFGPPCMSYFRS